MTSTGSQRDLDPESPCIDVCVMEPVSGFCLGCRRTIEEIIEWRDYSADQKRAVLDRLPTRSTV